MKRLSHILSLMLVLTLLSGCGYHLRGQGEHALTRQLQTLNLRGVNIYRGFGRELADAIESNSVQLVGDDDAADVVLRVSSPKRRRDVLSVDSSVYAREYSLVTSIRFVFAHSAEATPDREQWSVLEVRRDLVVNPNDVLGSDYEAERLNAEMDRELAERLIFRLRGFTVAGSKQSKVEPDVEKPVN